MGAFQGTPTTSNYRVRILSDSSGNPGSTVIATLMNPSSFTRNSVNVFTALANTTLAANTTYYVEAAQTDGSGGLPLSFANFVQREDSGSSSGGASGTRGIQGQRHRRLDR